MKRSSRRPCADGDSSCPPSHVALVVILLSRHSSTRRHYVASLLTAAPQCAGISAWPSDNCAVAICRQKHHITCQWTAHRSHHCRTNSRFLSHASCACCSVKLMGTYTPGASAAPPCMFSISGAESNAGETHDHVWRCCMGRAWCAAGVGAAAIQGCCRASFTLMRRSGSGSSSRAIRLVHDGVTCRTSACAHSPVLRPQCDAQ